MAVTLKEQVSLWPPATGGGFDDWLNDGEGMHSIVPLDLVRHLNNAATYVQPWAQYIQSAVGGTYSVSVTAAGEYALMQCPIIVPLGAVRMLWAAGLIRDTASGNAMTACSVYLSTTPYVASAQGAAFVPTKLNVGGSAAGQQIARTVTINFTTAGYFLVDDSILGVTNYLAALNLVGNGAGAAYTSNVIVTVTMIGGSSAAVLPGIADFSCWFGYE